MSNRKGQLFLSESQLTNGEGVMEIGNHHGRCRSKQLFPARTTIHRYSNSGQRRRGKGDVYTEHPSGGKGDDLADGRGHPQWRNLPYGQGSPDRWTAQASKFYIKHTMG